MRTFKQSGVSLIEVLVVMVLLLVGILSVVRLFPPGFLINRQTEATTLATRLAQQEIDRYANGSANLMDAILPVVVEPNSASPTGYYIKVDLNVTPDDLTDVANPPTGIDPYYVSNVNRIRWIRGETVRIPPPSLLGGGLRGAVYMLSTGPVYDFPGQDASGNTVESIVVTGAPLIRRLGDFTDRDGPFLRSPAQYSIDYDQGQIAFFASPYPRTFKITYSYYGANNDVQTVIAQPVAVPAGASPSWQPLNPPGAIVPDSDTVSRAFQRVAFPPVWSQDPYEFATLPRAASVANFANMGALIFNPLGRDYIERSAFGNQPLTAKIDYNVLDWRIIREDRPMPGTAPYQVRLTLNRIKQVGDYESDQSVYTGLWRDPGAPRVALLVYNLSTGQEVPPSEYTIDYRDGVVTFSDAFGAANGSGTFRFFYKAQGDWALQVQKAVSSYRRAPGMTANLGFGEYYLGGGVSGGDATKLYLPLTEAGKTITLREAWYYVGPGAAVKQANLTFRVNGSRSAFQTLAGRPLTWIDLRDIDGRATSWALDQPLQPAVGVQGISFKSRVLWSTGSTVTQTSTGNIARTRWHKTDLDTFLTRSPK